MTKKTKRKLSEAQWAIRTEADGVFEASYLHKGTRVMLFKTRQSARDRLQEEMDWVRELSRPVRVDVIER